MRRRRVRRGVLFAAVLGLMATTTPAEATVVKSVTVLGVTTLFGCGGLGYAGQHGVPETTTTTKAGPKGDPEVNTTVHNGNLCDFTGTASCVKLSAGRKTGIDACALFMSGTITGFCGLASGTGTAVLVNLTGLKVTEVTDFKFTDAGGAYRVSGGVPAQQVRGALEMIPTVGLCSAKSATGFTSMGNLVFKRGKE